MPADREIKRNTTATVLAALVLLAFCVCSNSIAQETRWLPHEPTVVELEGKLVVEPHYGPPGFGENPDTDEKARVPVLVLQQPVGVVGDPQSDFNTRTVEGITRIQLVFNTTSPPHKQFIGSEVIVKGTLFEAHTAHHYAEVLLTVQEIRKQADEFASLKNALSQHIISSFVVLRMPDEIDFQSALTPQRLRELHPPAKKYTIEMNDARATLLMDWINHAKFKPRKYSPDCRWGFLFMDRTGKELASLFSDKFGLAVNVDGHDVDLPDRRLLDTIHALVGPDVH